MKYFVIPTALTLLCVILASLAQAEKEILKAYASMTQLVRAAGYPIEKHNVHTADGYILQLYRIPNGVEETNSVGEKKKAVVLFHGLIGSSDQYIIMGPKKSLAYLLADARYDVWLANLRGNFFTSHQQMTRKDDAFWDYSFDEHGMYDAPAIIDKILEETGQSRVLYIGHSMGCTTFLAMLALRPEYNDKLVAFVGLAPAGYLDNIKGLVNFMKDSLDLPTFLRKKGIKGVIVPRKILEIVSDYCIAKKSQAEMCLNFTYAIVGEDYEQHPWEMTKVFIMRIQPASTQQLYHFGKFAITNVLTSWEGGLDGPVKPYNLSNIKTPVSLWYGENDQLTEMTRIQRLGRELNESGTLHSIRAVSWSKFNHLDFVFAKNVGEILNKPLVAHVKELFDTYYNDNNKNN